MFITELRVLPTWPHEGNWHRLTQTRTLMPLLRPQIFLRVLTLILQQGSEKKMKEIDFLRDDNS